jgi:hypothetical protein
MTVPKITYHISFILSPHHPHHRPKRPAMGHPRMRGCARTRPPPPTDTCAPVKRKWMAWSCSHVDVIMSDT